MSDHDRRQRGLAAYASQFGMSEGEVEEYFVSTFGREFAEEAFSATGGAAWSGTSLTARDRSLIVIAILATLGGVEQRLAGHVRWAERNGATEEEIRSTMTLVANYAGFARASVAMEVVSAELAAEGLIDDPEIERTWSTSW
jgi:4-carboxymuconolactone decarboxylase